VKYDVSVVGGGAAGLSAAVHLCRAGLRPVLLEARRTLGGRASSYTDAATGEEIDNGQHLLMGCYSATRELLRIIGSDHLLSVQPSLSVPFLSGGGSFVQLSCPPLPSPFHLLAGLLALPLGSPAIRLRAITRAFHLLKDGIEDGDVSVREWLTRTDQPSEWQHRFWDVAALAVMNDLPERASARVFQTLLKTMLGGRRENSSLAFPLVGLRLLIASPAERYILANGGEVRRGLRIDGIDATQDGFVLHAANGVEISSRALISAVPFQHLDEVFRDSTARGGLSNILRQAGALTHSAIVNVHLWFDRAVTPLPFAALLDGRFQWLFNTPEIRTGDKVRPSHLTLVMSGAGELVERSSSDLARIALEDVRAVFPASLEAPVTKQVVIKERRATMASLPGVDSVRPGTETPVKGLFLAGDWTATGYPATIEGAILSGRRAAESVEDLFRSHAAV